MDQRTFRDFVVAAARAATEASGQIGHLVLTQTYGPKEKPKIREPEMRHALAQCAECSGYYYGVEVPTNIKHRFKNTRGPRRVSGRHDFAVFSGGDLTLAASVLVELKAGQPTRRDASSKDEDCPAIVKDFVKLFCETAGGKSFVHVLPSTGSGTLSTLEKKYRHSCLRAVDVVAERFPEFERKKDDTAWFSEFVLVGPGRRGSGAGELHLKEWAGIWQFIEAMRQGEDGAWLSQSLLFRP
jgi:hypothetical protein